MDKINSPKHYQISPEHNIEVRDVINRILSEFQNSDRVHLTFVEASDYTQLMQYLMRFHKKGGTEDLKKAKYYLDKLIGSLEPELPQCFEEERFEIGELVNAKSFGQNFRGYYSGQSDDGFPIVSADRDKCPYSEKVEKISKLGKPLKSIEPELPQCFEEERFEIGELKDRFEIGELVEGLSTDGTWYIGFYQGLDEDGDLVLSYDKKNTDRDYYKTIRKWKAE